MEEAVSEAQVEAFRTELERLWNRRGSDLYGRVDFWDVAAERAGIPVWMSMPLSTKPRSFLVDERWVLERAPDGRGLRARKWRAEEDELYEIACRDGAITAPADGFDEWRAARTPELAPKRGR